MAGTSASTGNRTGVCTALLAAVGWFLLIEAMADTAAQAQQENLLAASISVVTATVFLKHTWSIVNSVDTKAVLVPVGINKGWAPARYTVTFTRRRTALATYQIAGQIVLVELMGRIQLFELPQLSLHTGSRRIAVPKSRIRCPSLAITPRGKLTCSFSAEYTAQQPVPGLISANVSTPSGAMPVIVRAQDAPYDFGQSEIRYIGDTATVTNYFEQGSGLIQPVGVSGEQPPPGLVLDDSREFTYLALFGDLDPSLCGQSWKALSTASLVPDDAAPGALPLQSEAAVMIELSGCIQPGFADTPSPAPVPAPPPVLPATPSGTPCGSGTCPLGSRCYDGWNCCPTATPVCGGVCCNGDRVCINNQCVVKGSTACDDDVCMPSQRCYSNAVCCTTDRVVCGSRCCDTGQQCIAGHCAAAGSSACGGTVCSPAQQCVQSICCPSGQTNCGGRCCTAGNMCLLGQYCVPQGSTVCQGRVCVFPQQCAGGMMCCNPGENLCAGSCCNQACIQNRCLPQGSTVCGPNVCDASRICLNNQVCCNPGETFCGTGCCAVGNACINNACVPAGSSSCGPTVICTASQFCGNPYTGLCCWRNQVACGRDCCAVGDVCNQAQQKCVAPDPANVCGVGQFWCSSAQKCCPNGWTCGAWSPCVAPWLVG